LPNETPRFHHASRRRGGGIRAGLAENSYVDGRNVAVEYRLADGQVARLPALMADLLRASPAVIATGGLPALLAARAATGTVPIAFYVSVDPVAAIVVRCNRGGTAVCKASIAAVLLAFGIIALVQEKTNAMVMTPAGLLPTLAIPVIETAALRRDARMTRHVAVRHRGVIRRRSPEACDQNATRRNSTSRPRSP
jgi:hypothetical protein